MLSMVEVIRPNVELLMLLCGFEKIGLLNTLNASARNVRFTDSWIGKIFVRARSKRDSDGPRRMFRPLLPNKVGGAEESLLVAAGEQEDFCQIFAHQAERVCSR